MDKYKELAQQPGVNIKGSLPHQQLVEELKSAKLMIYPGNHRETSCTAAIEAQAAGVPVVSSKIGALPETVEDGNTGVLISGEPNSKTYQKSFADTVIDLLQNKSKIDHFLYKLLP